MPALFLLDAGFPPEVFLTAWAFEKLAVRSRVK
jgi:hypothetical protein